MAADEVQRRRAESAPGHDTERLRLEAWVFGDPADFTFSDAQELEQAVDRMVERPNVRRALTRSAAAGVRRHYTTTSLAPKIIDLVRRSLS
jgi:glycosyltransferase involved in cell wall biosynthesis